MHLLFPRVGVPTLQRLFRAPLHIEKRALIALFLLLSLLLAACGGASSSGGSASKITLTVLESQGWVHDSMRDLAKKFETQTGIHIDYQIIPSANYFQVLKTKLNSGQGPDIFGGQSGVSDLKVNYNVETNAVDLSNEEWVKREDPNAVAQATVNGKVYGQEIWDIYSGYWVIVYNKSIFQKAGITSTPTTFNDFVADSAKIKANGVTPIYLVFTNALKTSADASSMNAQPPLALQWGNFGAVIDQGNLVTAFSNSVLYSFISTILAVVLAALAAYVLARRRTRRHEIIYLLLIMGIAIPTNFVTLTKVMQLTHLIDSQIGIILLYAATLIPFDVFLIYPFIESVPRELDEAAFIDGCSPLRACGSLILPLLTPVLLTCGVLNILNVWNEFLMPLYFLNNSDNWPMTLSVYNFFGQYESNWAYISADVVLTILPLFFIYFVTQRWILSGLSSGAVKG